MTALALIATLVFTHRLSNAYQDAGREQLKTLAATWDDGFRPNTLLRPDKLQPRIARLRELNPTISRRAA